MAAQNGKLEVCRFLLDNKANPTSIDSDGNSPLLLATAADHAGLKKYAIGISFIILSHS